MLKQSCMKVMTSLRKYQTFVLTGFVSHANFNEVLKNWSRRHILFKTKIQLLVQVWYGWRTMDVSRTCVRWRPICRYNGAQPVHLHCRNLPITSTAPQTTGRHSNCLRLFKVHQRLLVTNLRIKNCAELCAILHLKTNLKQNIWACVRSDCAVSACEWTKVNPGWEFMGPNWSWGWSRLEQLRTIAQLIQALQKELKLIPWKRLCRLIRSMRYCCDARCHRCWY